LSEEQWQSVKETNISIINTSYIDQLQ
jgi:hypothetical protein